MHWGEYPFTNSRKVVFYSLDFFFSHREGIHVTALAQYLAFGLACVLVLVALVQCGSKHRKAHNVCPTCPPKQDLHHHYLTEGEICQECAWDKFATLMRNKYN